MWTPTASRHTPSLSQIVLRGRDQEIAPTEEGRDQEIAPTEEGRDREIAPTEESLI